MAFCDKLGYVALTDRIFSVWWSPLILDQIFIINTIFSAEYEYDIYFHEKWKIVVQKEDLLCTIFQRALIKQYSN